jgi:hypothetical protein
MRKSNSFHYLLWHAHETVDIGWEKVLNLISCIWLLNKAQEVQHILCKITSIQKNITRENENEATMYRTTPINISTQGESHCEPGAW